MASRVAVLLAGLLLAAGLLGRLLLLADSAGRWQLQDWLQEGIPESRTR